MKVAEKKVDALDIVLAVIELGYGCTCWVLLSADMWVVKMVVLMVDLMDMLSVVVLVVVKVAKMAASWVVVTVDLKVVVMVVMLVV